MTSWLQVNRGLEHALELARESAARRGVAVFGPEFLLEALLERPQGLPVILLGRIGVALDDLRAELLERLGLVSDSRPVSQPGPKPDRATDGPAPDPPSGAVLARPDDAAQSALDRAAGIATGLGQPVVGQTHLLLALIQDPSSFAGELLARHGAGFEAVRDAMLAQMRADVARQQAAFSPDAPFSPLLRSILKDAPQMARLYRQAKCDPEHLLAALLLRGQGEAIAILRDHGVDLVDLSLLLEQRLDVREEEEETEPCREIVHSSLASEVLDRCRRLARSLGAAEADTEHLLLALLQVESLASGVLADFRLNEAAIRKRLAKEGTGGVSELGNAVKSLAASGADGAIAIDSNKDPRMTDRSTTPLAIQISQTPEAAGLPLPAYETAHAAAMDLRAAIPADAPVTLEPGRWGLVPTGLMVAIPAGFEGQVRARSGLAAKHGVGVLNGPGTIDADYRGEIKVILFNFSEKPFVIQRGDRIAQLAIARVARVEWTPVERLDETERGEGGFGHTGHQ